MGRKPNYGYEKHQRELARKAKKEAKKKRRAEEDQGGQDQGEEATEDTVRQQQVDAQAD